MTVSRDQFIQWVLENLGVLGSGQAVASEDRDRINRRIAPTFAKLSGKDIYYVADEDNLEDVEATSLAAIVAYECAPTFGIGPAKKAELAAEAARAEDDLEIIARARESKSDLKVDPFWRGRWSRYRAPYEF